MKMKIKNRSNRYYTDLCLDINTVHKYSKYSKYKECISMMMLICIKQHLSNIWSSIHEKVKQHRGLVEKSVAYDKKRVTGIPKMSKIWETCRTRPGASFLIKKYKKISYIKIFSKFRFMEVAHGRSEKFSSGNLANSPERMCHWCCFPEFTELLSSKIALTWHLCFIQKLHAFFLQRFKYFPSITLDIFFKKLQSSSNYVRQWTKYSFVTILFHSSGLKHDFQTNFRHDF